MTATKLHNYELHIIAQYAHLMLIDVTSAFHEFAPVTEIDCIMAQISKLEERSAIQALSILSFFRISYFVRL